MGYNRDEIANIIIETIKEVTFKKVTINDNLVNDGIIDSITVVDISVILEDLFKIKIPFVDLNEQHFGSIDSIANYIVLKLS